MWADPKTCLTVKSSGLPPGRNVQVYAFAPPYVLLHPQGSYHPFSSNLFNRSLTDAALSRLTSHLIVSLVYSHDVVTRLSLGSVRDLRNAAMWLCEAESSSGEGSGEGWNAVTTRARRWKDGTGEGGDMDWVSLGIFPSSCLLNAFLRLSSSRCVRRSRRTCKARTCTRLDGCFGRCAMAICTLHTEFIHTIQNWARVANIWRQQGRARTSFACSRSWMWRKFSHRSCLQGIC